MLSFPLLYTWTCTLAGHFNFTQRLDSVCLSIRARLFSLGHWWLNHCLRSLLPLVHLRMDRGQIPVMPVLCSFLHGHTSVGAVHAMAQRPSPCPQPDSRDLCAAVRRRTRRAIA